MADGKIRDAIFPSAIFYLASPSGRNVAYRTRRETARLLSSAAWARVCGGTPLISSLARPADAVAHQPVGSGVDLDGKALGSRYDSGRHAEPQRESQSQQKPKRPTRSLWRGSLSVHIPGIRASSRQAGGFERFLPVLKNLFTSASLSKRNSPGFNLSLFKKPIATRRSLITEWPM